MTREREYWDELEREVGKKGAGWHFEREEKGEEVPVKPEVHRKFKEKIKHKGAD